jgi:hypothetical protein
LRKRGLARGLTNRGNKEENEERQGCCLESLQVLEQLEKEAQKLDHEKKNLLDTEKVLLFKLKEAVDQKIKENQKLKLEVEKHRAKCIELAKTLNESIKESYSIS